MQWPADIPDDMLEDAITQAKKAMEEFNPEKEGTEVNYSFRIDRRGYQDALRLKLGALLARVLGEEFWIACGA